MENTIMKKTDRTAIPMDIIWHVARQYSSPADVLALAKMNKDTWDMLEPMVYQKEVTYTKATQRLAHKERSDLYSHLLAAFGGLELSTLPAFGEVDEGTLPLAQILRLEDGQIETAMFDRRHTQYEVLHQRLVTEDKNGLALHRAIARGPKESLLIGKLVAAAQIHNQQGYLDGLDFPILPPPLMKAAGLGYVSLVRQLLASGCNADIRFGNPSRDAMWNDGNYLQVVADYEELNGPGLFLPWAHSYPHMVLPEILKNLNTVFVKMREPDRLGQLAIKPAEYAAMRGNTAALKVLLEADPKPLTPTKVLHLYLNAGNLRRFQRFKTHDFLTSYPPLFACPPSQDFDFHEYRALHEERNRLWQEAEANMMLWGFMDFLDMSEGRDRDQEQMDRDQDDMLEAFTEFFIMSEGQ